MKVDLDGFVVSNEFDGTSPVQFKLTDLTNWYSSSGVRTEVSNIPLGDGGFNPTRGFRSVKTLSLEGVCYGGEEGDAISLAWQRIAALSPRGTSMTLTVEDASGLKTMRVWLNDGPQVLPFGPNRARFQINLVAPDPRKYGEVVESDTGPGGAVGTGGLSFPLGGNSGDPFLDFGTYSSAGQFWLENIGTAETWPTFRVRGAIASPGFQIVSDTDTIRYNAALSAGAEVILSPYAGGRAVQGGVDVTQNLVQADWPSIQPGFARQYTFTALGVADLNANLNTAVRPAYW